MEFQGLKSFYCQKCGTKLNEAGVCPNCGAGSQAIGPEYWWETERATKRIKHAVTAGIISTIATVVFAISGLMGFDLTALIDAFVILGLTFGVYKKNRGCAIALFVLWVIEKLVQWIIDPLTLFGLPIAILFGYFFFEGILGTFEYHNVSSARKYRKAVDQITLEQAITEQRLREQEGIRDSLQGRY